MNQLTFWAIVVFCVHFTGIAHAVHAVLHARTSQAAIAWSMALVIFPWIALPLYWLFGRTRLWGNIDARRAHDNVAADYAHEALEAMRRYQVKPPSKNGARLSKFIRRMSGIPCTGSNAVELFDHGGHAFSTMLESIAAAERYVLIQFFIVHQGQLSEAYADILRQKVREGVRVYFLFDAVGSYRLYRRYVRELREAGVEVASAPVVTRRLLRPQFNFRNHRKITVVDGRVAFVGGLNLADEYLGRHPRLGSWRDTHLRIEGPAVLGLQLPFCEDWHWATDRLPDLDWQCVPSPTGTLPVSVFPTGPADKLEECQFFILEAIHAARKRIWIASPYFVPGPPVAAALELAAVRGVKVRILLPHNPDHLLVYLASFSFYAEMERAGVTIYRYQKGFMHQKVILIDDDAATVGTVNLDNRSFHLNFEVTVLIPDREFAARVAAMLEQDFADAKRAPLKDIENRRLPFRAAVQLARLFTPIL